MDANQMAPSNICSLQRKPMRIRSPASSRVIQGCSLVFYILSAPATSNFVILFVVTVVLGALDFWVVKNSLARINKKDSFLFWWAVYLYAVAWAFLGIFSVIRSEPDYVLVTGVCLTLGVANIVGFTKCNKDAKKQLQAFATQTIANRLSSRLQTAFSIV